MISRRDLIRNSALLLGGQAILPANWAGYSRNKHLKIGTCDWSIGKTADVTGLQLAKDIGLDGLQVSLGTLENNMHLRKKEIQQAYLDQSRTTGIKISSLAIGELNEVPYKSDPRTDEWVWDSIEVAKNLGVTAILLAFFSNNDLRNDNKGKEAVVKKLRSVAPRAEKMGITLGIESYLTAEEHLEIMQQVGSSAIQVYYDFRNAADAGNDIYHELSVLGKNNICELHIKENGFLLGKGTLNWPRIAKALSDIGYQGDGWMQIEWARPEDLSIEQSYKHNLNYLRNIFN